MISHTLESPNITSRGSSSTALFVNEQADAQRRSLQEPFSYGLRRDASFNELLEALEECGQAGWDGGSAAPVTDATYLTAWMFIEALPANMPDPSIGVDPDGEITFEWHRSANRTVSVSIGSDHVLNFAALLGGRRYHGSEPFFGEVPSTIVQHVLDVYSD